MIAKGLLQPIQSNTLLVQERQYPYGPYWYWSKVFTQKLQKLGTLCPNFITNLVWSLILLHHLSWIHPMFTSFCTYLWANMHTLTFKQCTRWIELPMTDKQGVNCHQFNIKHHLTEVLLLGDHLPSHKINNSGKHQYFFWSGAVNR